MLDTLLGMTVFLHPNNNVLDDVSMMALQLFRESYWEFVDSIMMDFKLEQPMKAFFSILVTLLGMVMDVRLEQP